jgi:hypothetical protein
MDSVNVPEVQFRPIQLTIVDLIAVLFPAFLWLILLVTTFYLFWPDSPIRPVSPPRVLQELMASATSTSIWAFTTVIVTALIGYALKPLAMGIAERLLGLPILEPGLKVLGKLHFSRYADKMARRSIRFCELEFPFDCLHDDEDYFKKLSTYFETRLECPIAALPAHSLFSVAKRFLRLASPAMWEESERMEAEARMAGVVLLAALYSSFLSVVAMCKYRTDLWEIGFWFLVSLSATLVLALGFMRMRDREVTYTYINTLLVLSEITAVGNSEHSVKSVATSPASGA